MIVSDVIYHATNGGVTWVLDNQVSDSAMVGVAVSGGRAVAVGAGGAILRSDAL